MFEPYQAMSLVNCTPIEVYLISSCVGASSYCDMQKTLSRGRLDERSIHSQAKAADQEELLCTNRLCLFVHSGDTYLSVERPPETINAGHRARQAVRSPTTSQLNRNLPASRMVQINSSATDDTTVHLHLPLSLPLSPQPPNPSSLAQPFQKMRRVASPLASQSAVRDTPLPALAGRRETNTQTQGGPCAHASGRAINAMQSPRESLAPLSGRGLRAK